MFFDLLDLTVLNSWILLSLCGAKYSNRDFRQLLVRKLIEEAEKSQDRPNTRLVVRPTVGPEKVITNSGQPNHQPKCAAVCVSVTAKGGTVYKCTRCDVGLCMVPCLAEYQPKENL